MKIAINNVEFENADWNVVEGVGELSYPSEDSLLEVINSIGEDESIYVYNDEDTLLSVWQNGGFCGARTEMPNSIRTIYISFKVSIINDNTEARIDNDISESVDAIIELADMIAETSESVEENSEEIQKLKNKDEEFNELVTTVINKINSMPTDVLERFDMIWTSISSIADRVSQLENQ